MAKIDFTPLKLKHLKAPAPASNGEVARQEYMDATTPGFGLRVTSNGVRTWFVITRAWRRGKKDDTGPRWIVSRFNVGRCKSDAQPDGMTLAEARTKAAEIAREAKAGKDPLRQRRDAQREADAQRRNTFEAVADKFLKPGATKRERRPATIEQYKRILKGPACADLRDRALADIARRDITGLVRDIKAKGTPVAANRTLAAVRAMMNWAADGGYIDQSPAQGISAPSDETPRDRHLFGDTERNIASEIALAWQALGKCGWPESFLKILMLTGQRRGEVAGMRWDELLDLDGATPRWFLPAARTKNKRDHILPLAPGAVAILTGIDRIQDCPFVFTTTGKNPISGFGKIKLRADQEIAALIASDPETYKGQFATPWGLHDLRRTFDTGLRELGAAGDVVDALTNHISGEARRGARKHYNHARYDAAKRAAIEMWERHILLLVNPSRDNVVPLRAAT